LQVQENSPGQVAGLEPFFDFIVAIGNTRLVSFFLKVSLCIYGLDVVSSTLAVFGLKLEPMAYN
jgi:hypothetical protein